MTDISASPPGSTAAASRPAPTPAHVDRRLVVDFDYLAPPGFTPEGDVHEAGDACTRVPTWSGRRATAGTGS
jgi:hypothetical protein